jgi:uncharacterized protein with HEPN domain
VRCLGCHAHLVAAVGDAPQPIRLRNRIVHGYWSIDLEVLHKTATEQLPAFTANLRTVLSSVTGNA